LDLNVISNRITANAAAGAGKNSNGSAVAGAMSYNYNFSQSGTLSIPKLKMQVPIIWSQDLKSLDADLMHGVVHYPGTALPGEDGVIYISGHSSDYLWKNNAYAQAFAKLNLLQAGDDIFVSVQGLDGKTYDFRYQMQFSKIYKADDQAQFTADSGSVLNLSTCWPIGTQQSRLVVTARSVPL
jgi:LPXTG-site transpeptidase (sortase) family protein